MPSRWRSALRVAGALIALVVLAALVALVTIDRWLMAALDPGPFDTTASPPPPDYADPAAWAATPEAPDGAEVALPEHPAIDPTIAPAAVFFVHPTTAITTRWNAPIDDPAIVEATTRGATLIQASAFNGCCEVFAPRYRQANGRAFTDPSVDGDRAIDLAYGDVSAAFDAFLGRIGERPFILAGHSQGAVLGARLLRERIAATPALRARLIAAYLPGAPLHPGDVGVPVCEAPASIGCVAVWNARGPGHRPGRLDLRLGGERPRPGGICVNPITWRRDEAHAPASASAGAVFFDTPAPWVKPAFADARCSGGSLIITTMGDLERDLMSRILLWAMGPENYHPIEYQLYYLDIRGNAIERSAAFATAAAGR
ncbi:MAG: DUF3089 domain-containing protein [Myxococcales bacterium]|nr:DUF3089 domain-containing protein [Myxococcales bacterium]